MMAEDTDTEDDDIPLGNFVILTADEILFKGLNLLGWDTSRVEKWKSETALWQIVGCMESILLSWHSCVKICKGL
jgi:hypothetical protein